jgi:hypothetical protein
VNIAEGCPAAGVNNAFRELMAQIATWAAGTIAGKLDKAGGTMTGAILEMSTTSSVKNADGTALTIGYRNIPSRAKTSAHVLELADIGECIDITTGGVTVPPNSSVAFATGDTISIQNMSASSQTISQGAGVTIRLAGTTTTGNRTLAAWGWCSVRKSNVADVWISSGSGLT